MIKGGYKIVNFNGAALSGTAVTLAGIYHQIVDDYDKPVMVSGVSLSSKIMDDAYAGVQEKTGAGTSKYVELTVYGGIITVTDDDEVSFAVSKTNAELAAEIGDLDDLETTNKDSLVDAVNEVNSKVAYSAELLGDGLALFRFGRIRLLRIEGVLPKSVGVLYTGLADTDKPQGTTRTSVSTHSAAYLAWVLVTSLGEVKAEYAATYGGTMADMPTTTRVYGEIMWVVQ